MDELLELQVGLFERLGSLSERQAALIDADDSTGLLELLARQRMVDGIAELNRTLEPFQRQRGTRFVAGPERERVEPARGFAGGTGGTHRGSGMRPTAYGCRGDGMRLRRTWADQPRTRGGGGVRRGRRDGRRVPGSGGVMATTLQGG